MDDPLPQALSRLAQVVTEVGAQSLADSALQRLGKWAECVIQWREVAGLTGIRSPADVVTELMLPAVHAYPLLGPVGNVEIVDFGCGSGCTGVALAEVCRAGNWVLMDREERKVVFCRWALRECRIEGVEALDSAGFAARGGTADVVLARGLPRTAAVSAALGAAVRPGGCVIRWIPESEVPGHADALRCGASGIWVVRSRG
jgi:16S rRNA G527 N7-methylase RsmG